MGISDRMKLKNAAILADTKTSHRDAEVSSSKGPNVEPMPTKVSSGPATAPGGMAVFRQQMLHHETTVRTLEERLDEFKGSNLTRRLDPASVVRSKWANRHEQSFADKDFLRLKAEIDGSGGNVQPIKVRPLAGGKGQFEIVFGHRRHQACFELGLPVLAMIEDVSEQDLFAQMDRENRERKDLRPYEQGLMYAKALDDGLFPSAKKMAASIGIDLGSMGRVLNIARLPDVVLDAFGSRLDVQLKWGSEIKTALEANPEWVMEKAAELSRASPKLDAKSVYSVLLANPGATKEVASNSSIELSGSKGEAVSMVSDASKKTAVLKFTGVSIEQIQKIDAFVKTLLTSK